MMTTIVVRTTFLGRGGHLVLDWLAGMDLGIDTLGVFRRWDENSTKLLHLSTGDLEDETRIHPLYVRNWCIYLPEVQKNEMKIYPPYVQKELLHLDMLPKGWAGVVHYVCMYVCMYVAHETLER